MEPVTQAERLAALLDGRLGERERAELLAELGGSDEQLEILADAVAVTRELEEEDRAAGAIPISSARRGRFLDALGAPRVLRVAAAIIFVALGLTVWNQVGRRDAVASAVAALPEDAVLPELAHPVSQARGPGGPGRRAASFRFGVLATDMELTARRGEEARFKAFADSAAGVLRRQDAIAADDYKGFATAQGLPSVRTLRKRARETAESLAPRTVALGAWAEAARVAVARRDAGFFRHPASRRYVAANADVGELTDAGEDALGRARAAVAATGGPDWGALAQALDDLVAGMS